MNHQNWVPHNGKGRAPRGSGRGFRGGFRGRNNRNNNATTARKPISPQLIEPNKVYVTNFDKSINEQQLKSHIRKYVRALDVHIVWKRQGPSFGFIRFGNEKDTQILLNLPLSERYLNGCTLKFFPCKKQIKLPGYAGYKKMPLSDRDFNLESPDQSRPSLQNLNDDVLLKIFDYLSLKSLVKMERVCRRWQSLVYINCKKRASPHIQLDLLDWLYHNSSESYMAFVKMLVICGDGLLNLSLGFINDLNPDKCLRAVSQLCPSLDSFSMSSSLRLKSYHVDTLVKGCKSLKKLDIVDTHLIDDRSVEIILANLPLLEQLSLSFLKINSDACFKMLPSTLKILILEEGFSASLLSDFHLLKHLADRCPLLEVLRLKSICVPAKDVEYLGEKCEHLTQLSIYVEEDVNLVNFKKLKILTIRGGHYSLNKIISSVPQLEELSLDGYISESSSTLIDFSTMKLLKHLILPWSFNFSISSSSLRTIAHCPVLELLKFQGLNENKDALLQIIRCCPSLKQLYCPTITLFSQDIPAFVEANAHRSSPLKMVIGLDFSALDQIEKLNEGKYDIDMFDAHNLFREFSPTDEDFLDDLYYDSDYSDSFDGDDWDILEQLAWGIHPNGYFLDELEYFGADLDVGWGNF